MADQVTHAEHELRTHSPRQAGLEELRDGLVPATPARLSGLHDQTLRLARVVDDLAELAAAESAALSLHPTNVDLDQLVREAIHAHDAQLRTAALEVHTGLADGIVVHADPGRLHQALGNLLDNAARYGRPGDHVTVRLRPNGNWVALEVTDTGPGIPTDELPTSSTASDAVAPRGSSPAPASGWPSSAN